MYTHSSIVAFLVLSTILCCLAADILIESASDECRSSSSCSSCLDRVQCTWCVTKSRCTKYHCGNDNVIFPKNVPALMSGNDFCPRVVEGKTTSTYKSGASEMITVKLTQIYLYMAFTPWKCKIKLNGKETVVQALLLADSVCCSPFELRNESDDPYAEGSVTVLWDYNKEFDGSARFKVCRCDLEPACIACKQS